MFFVEVGRGKEEGRGGEHTWPLRGPSVARDDFVVRDG